MAFDDHEPSLNLNLSTLFPLPSKPQEPPTPPISSLVSVPFRWEEAPGKPRPCTSAHQSKPKTPRCLQLPPRLLNNQAKVANVPSTTSLDRRDPSLSRSFSYRDQRRSAIVSEDWGWKVNKERIKGMSSRWGKVNYNKEELEDSLNLSRSGIDTSGAVPNGTGTTKASFTRIRRRSNFSSFAPTRSHFWMSISARFKQVVPWKRSKRN